MSQVLEELKESVATLTRSVSDMKDGLVDRETVERIAAEVAERNRAAAEEANHRSGYQPEDVEDDGLPQLVRNGRELSHRDKLEHVLTRSAGRAAAWTGKSEETIKRFHEASDNIVLLGAVLANAAGPGGGFDLRETDYWREEFVPAVRAVSSSGAATGKEFIPTELSATLIDRVNLALRVNALFGRIPMPTNPFKLPARAVSRTRTGTHAEQTADTGQTKFKVITPGTRDITLTAAKFAARMLVSREAEEDSIIPMLPWMQSELVDFLAADLEDAILNGDTAGTHQDADVTASDDPRKIWEGLRQLVDSGAKTDGAGAATSLSILRGNRKKMGKFGVNPAELAHLLSVSAYIDLLGDTNVQTVDKYGPQATVLAGELAKADGIPVVVSEYVREDLNATGVNDATAANNTKTIAITVNRKGYVTGERRAVEVEIARELYIESDQDLLLASTRKAFQNLYPTTEKLVALTYNLAK